MPRNRHTFTLVDTSTAKNNKQTNKLIYGSPTTRLSHETTITATTYIAYCQPNRQRFAWQRSPAKIKPTTKHFRTWKKIESTAVRGSKFEVARVNEHRTSNIMFKQTTNAPTNKARSQTRGKDKVRSLSFSLSLSFLFNLALCNEYAHVDR